MKTKTLYLLAFIIIQMSSIPIVKGQNSTEKPPMAASVNNLQIGEVTKEELLGAGKVSLIESYQDDNSILSYRLTIISEAKRPIQLTSGGNGDFTAEMVAAIQSTQSGDKVYFEYIKCKSHKGVVRSLGSLAFKIK